MTAGAEPIAAAPVTPDAAAAEAAAALAAAAGTTVTPPAIVAPVVPEKYALALPADSFLSPAALERVTAAAKALKVTTDADAQALVGLAHGEAVEVIAAYEAAHKPGGEAHKAVIKQYEADALAHPALGNGNPLALERKALQAGLVLNRFAPELAPVLAETGLAARPEVLLLLTRLHDAMGEKALAMSTADANTLPKAPLEKQMFPGGIRLSSDAAP